MPRFSSRLLLLLAFALLPPAAVRAEDFLAAARAAQARLGPAVWSQVIRIENTDARNAYPREVPALVFELDGILWLYNPVNGTQSLSQFRGRLAEDKSDFGPLLRAIDPGFTGWKPVPAPLEAVPRSLADLPNGCFIHSVVAWRSRHERGDDATRARLLSYYVNSAGGLLGHTVLTYEVAGRAEVIDPRYPDRVTSFPSPFGAEALFAARALAGERIVGARWVPLDAARRDGRIR